jgi:hypothetical protein
VDIDFKKDTFDSIKAVYGEMVGEVLNAWE